MFRYFAHCSPCYCRQAYNSVLKLSNTRLFQTSCYVKNQQEDDEDGLTRNPYYEKYADKIKKAQATPEYQAKQEFARRDKRLQREIERWKHHHDVLEGKFSNSADTKKGGSKLPENLDDLMKLDLLEERTAEDISYLWMEYFKGKECVSAVIPAEIYTAMFARTEENPTFLYPLPKLQGYEFVLGQFEDRRCFFTSLLNYQVHGENSPWQMCLTHYTELLESKGIVLMTSEIDLNTMNVMEAQYLAQLLKLFYSSEGDLYGLVEMFNKKPDEFKYMDVIKAIESSNIVVK